jgi:glycosyltransferase involved in cell wall biosynthesis
MVKLTLLVTNMYSPGGVQRVVSLLANKLVEENKYDITILSMFKTADDPFFAINSKIKLKHIFYEPFNFKTGYFKAVGGIREYFKENDTDVLVFSGMGYGSIVYSALGNTKSLKIIGWEHQSFHYGKKFGLEWIGKRIASKKMDAVVVLTKEDYEYYDKGLNKIKKLVQIYNPAIIDNQVNSYNSNVKKIISCGSLVPQKGFDYAIEVANIVFKQYPEWQWHIFGDGPERKVLEEKIAEYGLENNVILMGYSDNVYKKYREYSLYVMSSRHEGFPMVLIEAKSNNLPIISFECKCGPRELIIEGENGYLVPCFDVEKMANRIIKLIGNEEKMKEFSKKASDGLSNLAIDNIVQKWEQLFNEVLIKQK